MIDIPEGRGVTMIIKINGNFLYGKAVPGCVNSYSGERPYFFILAELVPVCGVFGVDTGFKFPILPLIRREQITGLSILPVIPVVTGNKIMDGNGKQPFICLGFDDIYI